MNTLFDIQINDMVVDNKYGLISSYSELEKAEDIDCHISRSTQNNGISKAVLPGGKIIKLAKTLLTSACERNCYYCPFRAGRDYRRETLSPLQLASLVYTLHQRGLVDGIFLSSGIAGGGVSTQDLIIEAAELLRFRFGYNDYLHLKIMPGAEYDQVFRTMQLANRVSINLEGPNEDTLQKLAPHKSFYHELLTPLHWVEMIRKSKPAVQGWNQRWPSATTQFVVGGAGENDHELLQTTDYLYKKLRLSRIYYSAFNPVKDTPLEHLLPTNPDRQNRLYQANFMLRDYGFILDEIPFDKDGFLPVNKDPKYVWAQHNLMETPIELNRAERHELLRIPGIGIRSADQLITARQLSEIRTVEDLHKIGIKTNRLLPFVLLDGKRPPQQLTLI